MHAAQPWLSVAATTTATVRACSRASFTAAATPITTPRISRSEELVSGPWGAPNRAATVLTGPPGQPTTAPVPVSDASVAQMATPAVSRGCGPGALRSFLEATASR